MLKGHKAESNVFLLVPLDLVLLDKRTAAEVRVMMKTMLGDSDRRQALIQELVQSNNQLK